MTKIKKSRGKPNEMANKKHDASKCACTTSYRTSGGWRRCIACMGVV